MYVFVKNWFQIARDYSLWGKTCTTLKPFNNVTLNASHSSVQQIFVVFIFRWPTSISRSVCVCVCVCARTRARACVRVLACVCVYMHVQITVIIKNIQLEFIIASVCSTILLFNDNFLI